MLGDYLKTIRKEKNITQKDLARELNISQSYLSDIENGRKNLSINTIERIAKKLGVSIAYLTSDNTQLNKEKNFNELGNFLRAFRESKNVTLRKLGLKINYSPTYISSVENGKKKNPSRKFLEAFIYGLTEEVGEIREAKNNVNILLGKDLFGENEEILTVNQYERGYEAGYKEAKQLVVQELMKNKTTEEKAKILDELIMCLIKQ